jgi:hypothetical protein
MKSIKIFIGISLLVFCGCATVNTKQLEKLAELPKQKNDRVSFQMVPQEALSRTPKSTYVLAIQLIEDENSAFKFSAVERGEIVGWIKKTRNKANFKNIFLMSGVVSNANEISEVRQAAAERGANLLLVLKTKGSVVKSHNPLALLYLTLVGYFIVPGSNAEAGFAVDGEVLDVWSGRAKAKMHVVATGHTWGPKGFLDTGDAISRAKKQALTELERQFLSADLRIAPKK